MCICVYRWRVDDWVVDRSLSVCMSKYLRVGAGVALCMVMFMVWGGCMYTKHYESLLVREVE